MSQSSQTSSRVSGKANSALIGYLGSYRSLQALLEGEMAGGAKTPLPGAGGKAVTERPANGTG